MGLSDGWWRQGVKELKLHAGRRKESWKQIRAAHQRLEITRERGQFAGRDLDVAMGENVWLAVQAPDGTEFAVKIDPDLEALGVLMEPIVSDLPYKEGEEVLLWTTGDSTCPVPRGCVLERAETERQNEAKLSLEQRLSHTEKLATIGPPNTRNNSTCNGA